MSDTESFESIVNAAMEKVHGNYEIEAIEVAGILGTLLAAHDREIAQAQRSTDAKHKEVATRLYNLRFHGGRFGPELSHALEGCEVNEDTITGSYSMALDNLDRLREAYDRDMQDARECMDKLGYHRGYCDGQHSMDAEHRAVAMRLRQLPLDGGSHENLSQIARAVYHADFGWTQGACAALRDKLIDLMEGVSDDTCGAGCCCAAADSDGDCGLQREEVTDERLADDCGADSRGGAGSELVHMAGVSITDELRKFAMTYKNVWYDDSGSMIYTTSNFSPTEDAMSMMNHINEIADRIDVQFDRICEQHEAVLQSTIERMADENLTAKDERDHWKREASELRSRVEEYDSTHVELPRDKDDRVFVIDGGAKVEDLVLTIRQMTLTKEGWKVRAYDEDYEVEREASFFDACAPKPNPIEETIEKLTLGEITQTEAIKRIKSLGQE